VLGMEFQKSPSNGSRVTSDKVCDIHMSVYRNITPYCSQQDTTFLDLFILTGALHVSGGSSAYYQEHITVRTTSGIFN
jgi:hypothetical protein